MPPARRPHAVPALALVAALAAISFAARPAMAQSSGDHVYVVGAGDTVSQIAERLGVSTRALVERNHLEAPYTLRVGRRLRLPDGVSAAVARSLPPAADAQGTPSRNAAVLSPRARAALSASDRTGAAGRGWGRPRNPGFVRMVRECDDEQMDVSLRRVGPRTLRRIEHMLRFNDGRHHPIHPRLVRQLAIVSDHFGGRRLHVISGFRPFRRGQYTRHSNHNIGHAVDFRVEGVPNRVLRDFCRTLPQTGCGFYPRSVFVHMDVREESTTWVDWSRPGQRPIYGREDRPPEEDTASSAAHAPASGAESVAANPAANAGGEADESVDDVADDNARVRTAPAPAEASETATPPAAPTAP